jgi:molybdopterin-guanine dinucleotide biosynthesis protein A
VLTGVVLAGGRSVRFGADKLRTTYRGAPLVHHAALRLAEVCDDVVVVLAPGHDGTGLPPGVRTANDAAEGQGPLAGLQAGLAAAPRSDAVLVIGGDMPDLQGAVAREMVSVLDEASVDAVVLADGGRSRPLPCVLRTTRATEVVHALLHDGRRRLRDAIDGLRTAVIDEATWTALDPDRRSVFDVDEPGDMSG